jgi:lipid II:glycine glycyltransferase (peptidoglycan interpeptide bridge formation enzyme)
MYSGTAERDGFVIRPQEYYKRVWRLFMEAGFASPLIAEVNGEPVAALILFWFSRRAWYLYGMSLETHREKMPNYLLQWEAMRLAKVKGCQLYDLWGAPDVFDESDSLWGVYRFKDGFGGTVIRNIGAWDYPVRRRWYQMYAQIMPNILAWMRSRGSGKTGAQKSAQRDI